MKKWVVDNEGMLGIVTTSGFRPSNGICEAGENWTPQTITHDKDSGVVFLDPEKVRARLDEAAQIEVQIRNKQLRDRIKRMAPAVFYFSIAFSVGYFVAKVLI